METVTKSHQIGDIRSHEAELFRKVGKLPIKEANRVRKELQEIRRQYPWRVSYD